MNEMLETTIGAEAMAPADEAPAAFVAMRIAAQIPQLPPAGLIYIAASETRAEDIAAALTYFDREAEILLLPPWDCLPYDRASPSRESMGRRMAVLRRLLAKSTRGRVLVTSVEAALQRVPPRRVIADTVFMLKPGEAFDRDAFASFSNRAGYVTDDRVDEPGEVALSGQVVDIYPADAAAPSRLMLDETGKIAEILRYDPLTQRTDEPLPALQIGAASELVFEDEAQERIGGIEHRLPEFYPQLETLFRLLPAAALALAADADARVQQVFTQIEEAFAASRDFGAPGEAPLPAAKLHLTAREWRAAIGKRTRLEVATDGGEAIPRFWLADNPSRALGSFMAGAVAAGHRVVIGGANGSRRRLARMADRALGREAENVKTWSEVLDATPGVFLAASFQIGAGFTDAAARLTLITESDVFGTQALDAGSPRADPFIETELRVGDVVVHEDHGLGVLRALERVEVDGVERDTLRVEYHGGAALLVPVEDFGRIWRYGAEEAAIKLDRLNTESWQKRRAELQTEIDAAAASLVEIAKMRLDREAPVIVPPRSEYQRFAARFPFPATRHQSAAIDDVLKDLAAGHPMNRLVCGDVGFGKTEVALRAAAAAVLSGFQVAVVAPTTVLVRQHLETFSRRFAHTGARVAQLSRLLSKTEAAVVRQGLESGEIGVVIATQAIVADDVRFKNLGLLVIDEEHRFGVKLKRKLQALGDGLHALSMSATPIPRTLQAALVGVEDVSIIATPPVRRRPVRTFLTPFDGGLVRTALLRERRRGGQSFVVVPRIDDIEPIAGQLANLVPELAVSIAHGDLPPSEVDETVVRFASGQGDVLLATNIIESGLDVPRANTMLVWRADRFGLAQLHQLRGRVGRGRVQGVVYLLTDPQEEIGDATRTRLSTLETLDRLGAGFEISGRDLDLRGAGDLLGEEQTGHMKLIGIGLYQQLLERAVRAARGEAPAPDWRVGINLGASGAIPVDYVPEAATRISLYARLMRMRQAAEVAAFAEELEDRFGELPEEALQLLAVVRLATLAQALGIEKIEGGPLAIALTFRAAPPTDARKLMRGVELEWKGERLVSSRTSDTGGERLAIAEDLLRQLEALLSEPRQPAAVNRVGDHAPNPRLSS